MGKNLKVSTKTQKRFQNFLKPLDFGSLDQKIAKIWSRPARFFRARYAFSVFKYAKNMLLQIFALET